MDRWWNGQFFSWADVTAGVARHLFFDNIQVLQC